MTSIIISILEVSIAKRMNNDECYQIWNEDRGRDHIGCEHAHISVSVIRRRLQAHRCARTISFGHAQLTHKNYLLANLFRFIMCEHHVVLISRMAKKEPSLFMGERERDGDRRDEPQYVPIKCALGDFPLHCNIQINLCRLYICIKMNEPMSVCELCAWVHQPFCRYLNPINLAFENVYL